MTPSEAALSKLLSDNGYRVLRNGWPDLLVIPPDGGPGFAIELKSGTDAVKPVQKTMHAVLEAVVKKVVATESALHDDVREHLSRAGRRGGFARARSMAEADRKAASRRGGISRWAKKTP